MNTPRPILVDIKVNGKILTMEVGRSAGLSLISESTFKQMMSEDLDNLQESSVHMRTSLKLLGKLQVTVIEVKYYLYQTLVLIGNAIASPS